jgi:Spy/CpxP family protein refolding chaperone
MKVQGAALLALTICMLWAAIPVSAQGFKWWQNEGFRRDLGLTEEQSARLEEIFQKSLPTLRAKMDAVDKAEMEFDRLVDRGDDATVMQQVNTLEDVRAEMNKARVAMLLKMRRSLTADQWAKFTALNQARQRERGRERERSQRGGPPGRRP